MHSSYSTVPRPGRNLSPEASLTCCWVAAWVLLNLAPQAIHASAHLCSNEATEVTAVFITKSCWQGLRFLSSPPVAFIRPVLKAQMLFLLLKLLKFMEASGFAIPSYRSALADEVRYQLPSQDITAGLCPHRGRIQLGSHTGLSWAHKSVKSSAREQPRCCLCLTESGLRCLLGKQF